MLEHAIESFKKIARAEKRLEKLNMQLKRDLVRLSKPDMASYMNTTRLWVQGQ